MALRPWLSPSLPLSETFYSVTGETLRISIGLSVERRMLSTVSAQVRQSFRQYVAISDRPAQLGCVLRPFREKEAWAMYSPGGTVTETGVGDDEGYYEVQVTLDDGSQVDVHLDEKPPSSPKGGETLCAQEATAVRRGRTMASAWCR